MHIQYQSVNTGKRLKLKYSTTSGVLCGFDQFMYIYVSCIFIDLNYLFHTCSECLIYWGGSGDVLYSDPLQILSGISAALSYPIFVFCNGAIGDTSLGLRMF